MHEGLTTEEWEWLDGAVREFSAGLGRDDNLATILQECESRRDRIDQTNQWRGEGQNKGTGAATA